MDIQLKPEMMHRPNPGPARKKDEQKMAMEFEKLFARQLVKEMTKGLFKHDDNKPMMAAGNNLYRGQIVDTLAEQLAEQHKLGMADMIMRYVNQKNSSKK